MQVTSETTHEPARLVDLERGDGVLKVAGVGETVGAERAELGELVVGAENLCGQAIISERVRARRESGLTSWM